MTLALEYAGAVGVLVAFWLSQTGSWPPDSARFQGVNVVSAAALTAAGAASGQWGFAVLNGAWTAIALVGLLRRHVPRRQTLGGEDGRP